MLQNNEPAALENVTPAAIQLEDVAKDLGLHVVSNSGTTAEKHFPSANGTGVGMVDFDLDGWMDVFVCQGCVLEGESNGAPCSNLQSQRGKAFRDVASLAGVALRGYTAGVSTADVNGDGFPDLHLTRVNDPFRFYVNNGDGTMTDHSAESGLNQIAWGTSAAWLDFDNDGNPDLYVANYGIWDLEWHRAHPCLTEQLRGKAPARMFCGPRTFPRLLICFSDHSATAASKNARRRQASIAKVGRRKKTRRAPTSNANGRLAAGAKGSSPAISTMMGLSIFTSRTTSPRTLFFSISAAAISTM